MASDICVRRLTKELTALRKDPILEPRITVAPNERNLLEMHYVIEGSKDTPYEGGIYHGKLLFPKEYPLKPPGVIMITPSGRFQPDRRLCLSMSDFHPESWNPMWSVSTILTGLYSFMIDTKPTLGSIETSTRKKRHLAAASLEYNVKNNPTFCKLFPEYVERYESEIRDRKNNGTSTSQQQQQQSDSLISSDAGGGVANAGGEPIEIPRAFLAGGAAAVAVLSIFAAMRFL